jgi:hypothetical protein
MSTDADAVDYSAEPSADVASGGFNFAGVEDAAQPDDGVQQMQEDDSNAAGDAQSAQAQGVCTLLSVFCITALCVYESAAMVACLET